MRERLTVNEDQFRRVAYATLVALDADRADGRGGAADRLRARLPGLAEVLRQGRCRRCSTHALIEFGNRALSGVVGVLTRDRRACSP